MHISSSFNVPQFVVDKLEKQTFKLQQGQAYKTSLSEVRLLITHLQIFNFCLLMMATQSLCHLVVKSLPLFCYEETYLSFYTSRLQITFILFVNKILLWVFHHRTWYFQEQNSGNSTYKNTSFYKEGILGHSCNQWILRLMRKMMMTYMYLVYIGYENLNRIHIERDILPLRLLVQQKSWYDVCVVKGRLQSYCDTFYLGSSINKKWMVKKL